MKRNAHFLNQIRSQLFRDVSLPLRTPPLLSRGEFVEKYLSKYKDEWKPDYRIRTYIHKKTGRLCVPTATEGTVKSQNTKRDSRIDSAYAMYLEIHNEALRNQATTGNKNQGELI